MGAKRTFRAVFEPDEGGWHAYIPEVPGCRTWGRSLSAARTHLRDALGLALLDLPEATAKRVAETAILEEDLRLPRGILASIRKSRDARAKAKLAESTAQDATQRAIEALTHAGMSVRDAGALLGVSGQRVHKLAGGVHPRIAKAKRPVAAE